MGTYSIKDLEKLSGIKAHTLRMWENRYGIIKPKRTDTKIRYFNDEELRLVLNISFLNQNGYKISRIAQMGEDEIFELVSKISHSDLKISNQINALTIAMINLDEARFNKIIATNTLQFGFEKTMLDMVYPFLNRIGILWQTGNINPAHEHFISNLIRQKLIIAIDGQISPQSPEAKKYAFFLPENELHELSLLFACYLVKARHNKAIYLGQSLPVKDLETVYEVYQPDYMLTVVTSYPSGRDVVEYVNELEKKFPKTQLLITGFQAIKHRAKFPADVCVFSTIQELVDFIDKNTIPVMLGPN